MRGLIMQVSLTGHIEYYTDILLFRISHGVQFKFKLESENENIYEVQLFKSSEFFSLIAKEDYVEYKSNSTMYFKLDKLLQPFESYQLKVTLENSENNAKRPIETEEFSVDGMYLISCFVALTDIQSFSFIFKGML